MTNTDPKELVSRGYNKVSYAYRETNYDIANSPYKAWLVELTSRLNKGDRILDLGCGCGVPVACILAEQFAVTGVDISPVQIERARELGLSAEFVCADMVELGSRRAARVIRKMHQWLTDGEIGRAHV